MCEHVPGIAQQSQTPRKKATDDLQNHSAKRDGDRGVQPPQRHMPMLKQLGHATMRMLALTLGVIVAHSSACRSLMRCTWVPFVNASKRNASRAILSTARDEIVAPVIPSTLRSSCFPARRPIPSNPSNWRR